jgi:hypothetical protein
MDHAQRLATEIALSVLAEDGFILAGGQALAEHGVIDRLSKDVDLFALHRKHTPAVVMDLGLDWWENQPAIVDFGPVCP